MIRSFLLSFLISIMLGGIGCKAQTTGRVTTGAEVLLAERLDLLAGKRVGLITNQTGKLPAGGMLVDSLLARGIHVVALFAPEHGIRGAAKAGENVGEETDSLTGIHVFSLHGQVRKPTTDMLSGIDILLYDIQDVGVRFYSYISTMGLAMEAAGEAGIPFVVLDRPNPLGGMDVEGPILDPSLKSFLGLYPIPVIYGMTCGELARMIVGEGWLTSGSVPQLTVIPMQGWSRSMTWDECSLPWVPPSPNIPTAATAMIYPATCYIEQTALSEGRGTPEPFRLVGAPFVDGAALTRAINNASQSGVVAEAVTFTPTSSKFAGEECGGIRLRINDFAGYSAARTGFHLFKALRTLYPNELDVRRDGLARLLGSAKVADWFLGESDEVVLGSLLESGLDAFRIVSSRYWLYR